ncbi:hypothetical protein GCM10017784_35350 [Deinococcus indicus]|uniref:hypothetical protein n=1 Tax=Deinococcus indicus TaxID=223556 RepID=UPI00174CC070|nr:hypothetical protein [Deinococcus indicus]GHG37809.1 hypothetical protein GCM10017784_35350 [Deinococcus indicus]
MKGAPLRKVLRIVDQPIPNTQHSKQALLLECGHTARIPHDHMGERHPDRRRCMACFIVEAAQ